MEVFMKLDHFICPVFKRKEELEEEIKRLRGRVQAVNMKIKAAKWAHHLQERGLHPYCNAPCLED